MASAAELADYLATAEQVAREAGKMIREAHEKRSSGLKIESKGSDADAADESIVVDLVTATDKACEDHIQAVLKERYPDHGFIGEEGSFVGAAGGINIVLELPAGAVWIVDPLDGTTNFVHGYPLVTVSIGLAVAGELVLGVIYNPIMDELCSAVRGGGTHLNGHRVHVASAKAVTEALVCNNMGASRAPSVNKLATDRLLALLQASIRGLRNSGSAAQNMMHVACGRLDAYFEDGFGGPWDVAAGKVIVEEAGGVLTMVNGDKFQLMAGKGQVICGNAAVAADLARVLNTAE